jgi:hypothetical protein
MMQTMDAAEYRYQVFNDLAKVDPAPDLMVRME